MQIERIRNTPRRQMGPVGGISDNRGGDENLRFVVQLEQRSGR